MIPALILLKAHGAELGMNNPWQMFWAAGALSSFLDNTPTYLVFLQTAGALGCHGRHHDLRRYGFSDHVGSHLSRRRFHGCQYLHRNAPNFMVKSIAEENKIKMPSFFGYMGWSIAILIPVFIINTFVFFL